MIIIKKKTDINTFLDEYVNSIDDCFVFGDNSLSMPSEGQTNILKLKTDLLAVNNDIGSDIEALTMVNKQNIDRIKALEDRLISHTKSIDYMLVYNIDRKHVNNMVGELHKKLDRTITLFQRKDHYIHQLLSTKFRVIEKLLASEIEFYSEKLQEAIKTDDSKPKKEDSCDSFVRDIITIEDMLFKIRKKYVNDVITTEIIEDTKYQLDSLTDRIQTLRDLGEY